MEKLRIKESYKHHYTDGIDRHGEYPVEVWCKIGVPESSLEPINQVTTRKKELDQHFIDLGEIKSIEWVPPAAIVTFFRVTDTLNRSNEIHVGHLTLDMYMYLISLSLSSECWIGWPVLEGHHAGNKENSITYWQLLNDYLESK